MEEAIFDLINLNLAKRTIETNSCKEGEFILYANHETRDLWESLMQVLKLRVVSVEIQWKFEIFYGTAGSLRAESARIFVENNTRRNKMKNSLNRPRTENSIASYFHRCVRLVEISCPLSLESNRMFAAYLLKFLVPLALMNCISARVALTPKFFGQDSAIIVDTDKTRLNPKLQNALYYNFPVYKLIRPGAMPVTSTTSTTTTPSPATGAGTIDDYPSDLLHLARNKLGLKSTDQLPSLNDLGELLGTGNAADTIQYIRTLISDDQGIALMKDYLASMTDYDQADADADTDNEPEEDEEVRYNEDDNNADIEVDYEALPVKKTKQLDTTTKAAPTQSTEQSGIMKSVNDFMQQYGLWSAESSTAKPVSYQPVFVAPVRAMQSRRPVLVRQPLPYHFPIPLRPAIVPQVKKVTPRPAPTTSTPAPTTTSTTPVPSTTLATTPRPAAPHLNSPKELTNVAPHVQQLAEIANISPTVLDQFLQQQPKLAELAKRVSRLPLVQQHSRAIDSQLLLAVKKALSQDENLKRLLGAADTLK